MEFINFSQLLTGVEEEEGKYAGYCESSEDAPGFQRYVHDQGTHHSVVGVELRGHDGDQDPSQADVEPEKTKRVENVTHFLGLKFGFFDLHEQNDADLLEVTGNNDIISAAAHCDEHTQASSDHVGEIVDFRG